MSKTTDFILNNPGKNFDGSPTQEMENYFEPLPQQWQGMTKADIEKLADVTVDLFLEGGGILQAAERISAFEAFLKAIKEDARYKQYVIEELEKSAGKVTTSSGAKIEKMEGGVRYNYENCGDWEWELLKWKAEAAANDLKAKEKELQAVSKPFEKLNPETGEVGMVYPAAKSSTTTYKVILKK